MSVKIEGTEWFFRLRNKKPGRSRGLLDARDDQEIASGLVIQLQLPPEEEGARRLYALFPSYVEFARYRTLFPPERWHFHEVILGLRGQKPRFDIDIDRSRYDSNPDVVVDAVVDALAGLIVGLDVERDVLVFTSHGKSKYSYHIVVDRFFHDNHEEARAFFALMCQRVPEGMRSYLDDVYRSVQGLRTLGSTKPGESRPKIFLARWFWHEREIKHPGYVDDLALLAASLVSVIARCSRLPSYALPSVRTQEPDIDDERVRGALEALCKAENTTLVDLPYSLREVNGNTIYLARERPSFCRICAREHEHENPYLRLRAGGIYLVCRRALAQGLPSEELIAGEVSPPIMRASTDRAEVMALARRRPSELAWGSRKRTEIPKW